jgi:PIN domain nuclease of toxin-antitoxin system
VGRRGLSRVLLDTHTWAWSLISKDRLSPGAVGEIQSAEAVCISAISPYEIGQKVRLGKWPEMADHFVDLLDIAEKQGALLLPVSPQVTSLASVIDWDHRDPFDRLIGTTALVEGLVLISADTVFDQLSPMPQWPGRIW